MNRNSESINLNPKKPHLIHQIPDNNLPFNIPKHIKNRVETLVRYATNQGILHYIAYNSALRYVLYHEYPEYLLKYDVEIPMRGYMKCLRIWRDAGLVRPISKMEAVEKALSSREFESALLQNGVPASILDSVKDALLRYVRGRLLKGSLRDILHQLIQVAASRYRGGAYGWR